MKDIHSIYTKSNQSSLEEVVSSSVLRHIAEVIVDSENSPSAAYLPAERFLKAVTDRLMENTEFIQQIAEAVVSRSSSDRPQRMFYKLKEVARMLNKQPKPFSRVAEEQYGLEKIHIGNEVNFRAEQVERLVAELKSEPIKVYRNPNAA